MTACGHLALFDTQKAQVMPKARGDIFKVTGSVTCSLNFGISYFSLTPPPPYKCQAQHVHPSGIAFIVDTIVRILVYSK